MKAALYARVSTSDQNPEMQLQALRDFAQLRGFTVYKEYIDQVTGNLEKRQKRKKAAAFVALMEDASRRRFKVVVVWKFDRFARSLSGLIEALQVFSSLGIDFISQTQSVDTTTPMGRLFFHIVGAFAEFEREVIVERVNAGLANARRKGIILGRPRKPHIDHRIVALRHQGHSLRQIGRDVGRSAAAVMRVLTRVEAEKHASNCALYQGKECDCEER